MIIQDSIQFGTTRIGYDIVYSDKRNNASLAVYPYKQVEIVVPNTLKREHIQALVRKKADWVVKQLVWFDEIAQVESTKEYVSGETFLYLGRQYRLKIEKGAGRPQAKLIGGHFLISLPKHMEQSKHKKAVKALIWRWYRAQAHDTIGRAIKYYSRRLGIPEAQFIIKNQYKRWGSCTSKGTLIFNIRAVMAPMSQMEYIVAHELCHIKHNSHSHKFWNLLRAIMPDYEERKERLRKDGWKYTI